MLSFPYGEPFKPKMSKKFDKYLDQATDSKSIEADWESIILCTDSIRSGEVPAHTALLSIRKRLQHENPHVVSHALLVLDACVKNCGRKMHEAVSTREFMEEFKNLITENGYDKVKEKGLEMLQCWATAFANKPEYKMVVDTHNLMKLAGFDFPSLKEADAMFMSQVAPEWKEGDVCFRCRTSFTLFTRKHHCRKCGQIFCDKCSSRELQLPQFGIHYGVRVCETCFEQTTDELAQTAKKGIMENIDKRKEKLKSNEDEEKKLIAKEEEELALALAISQSEAEAKERENMSFYTFNGLPKTVEASTNESLSSYHDSTSGGYKGAAAPEPDLPADDPLAKYLNRDYWQQKKDGKVEEWAATNSGFATAPPPSEPSNAPSICSTVLAPDDQILNNDFTNLNVSNTNSSSIEEGKARTDETLKWCQSIREQVTVMDNRIRSNLARGRPVFNDSAIQDLFTRLTEIHSHVLCRMHTLDDQRSYYESLQDQLANIGEARQAINELREEHERKKQERLAEEQRRRQAQMQQTLEMMRMKKHAMLMEQRDQALQRFQQQQQEMAMRRQQQSFYPTGGYTQGQEAPVPNQQYYGYAPNSSQYQAATNGQGHYQPSSINGQYQQYQQQQSTAQPHNTYYDYNTKNQYYQGGNQGYNHPQQSEVYTNESYQHQYAQACAKVEQQAPQEAAMQGYNIPSVHQQTLDGQNVSSRQKEVTTDEPLISFD